MLTKITVADYMTKHVVTLTKEMDVFVAIQRLLTHKITNAPVLDGGGHLVGMFSERDCMRVVLEHAYNQGSTSKVSEFMTAEVSTVTLETSIVDLAENFQASQVRSFPVLHDKKLVGIISRTDVLRALAAV
ncbi:MAG: CBS domain-containing protein [Methylococcales bacterium]